jgi:hypothetical protein
MSEMGRKHTQRSRPTSRRFAIWVQSLRLIRHGERGQRPLTRVFDWRENAREIGIVVIGVWIALLAQQTRDAWEWSQKVKASQAAIRHELLSDDGPEVYQRVALHPCMQARLDDIRAAVEVRETLM